VPEPPEDDEAPPEPEPPVELDLALETVELPTVLVKVEEPEVIVLTTGAVETAVDSADPPAPPAAPKIVVAPRVEVKVDDPLLITDTA